MLQFCNDISLSAIAIVRILILFRRDTYIANNKILFSNETRCYLAKRRGESEGIRMGLLTWIAIIIIILAVIGLGAGVFFSGVMRGAEIVRNSPVVQNITEEAKEFVQSTNLSDVE